MEYFYAGYICFGTLNDCNEFKPYRELRPIYLMASECGLFMWKNYYIHLFAYDIGLHVVSP